MVIVIYFIADVSQQEPWQLHVQLSLHTMLLQFERTAAETRPTSPRCVEVLGVRCTRCIPGDRRGHCETNDACDPEALARKDQDADRALHFCLSLLGSLDELRRSWSREQH